MATTILYFAWVRERVGTGEERLDMPAGVITVADLARYLAGRGRGYAAAFAEPERLRVAIDLQMADFDAPVAGAREIAFFPPVTGG